MDSLKLESIKLIINKSGEKRNWAQNGRTKRKVYSLTNNHIIYLGVNQKMKIH